MLDEDANFGRHPAAGRSHGKDRHCSLKRSEKTYNSSLSEFRGEQPCRRLGDPEMFKHTLPHLFEIAGPKNSAGDNALGVRPGSKAPRLHRTSFYQGDRLEAIKIIRRLRRAVACEVLRSGDKNGHRLRESFRYQSGVRKIPVVDRQIEAVLDDGGGALGRGVGERMMTSGLVPYSATKGAVKMFTQGLSREVGSRGITVNNVQPGPIDTDLNPAAGEWAAPQKAVTALNRYGTVDEVAALVSFVAGPESSYITGANLTVDGGTNA